mgnify:CR=1 FL=1
MLSLTLVQNITLSQYCLFRSLMVIMLGTTQTEMPVFWLSIPLTARWNEAWSASSNVVHILMQKYYFREIPKGQQEDLLLGKCLERELVRELETELVRELEGELEGYLEKKLEGELERLYDACMKLRCLNLTDTDVLAPPYIYTHLELTRSLS